ncbi:octopine dehydrogenase-like [Acropora millepora]|uniref:octopine dehydrogenase-like n=1 Tax=Acropora millepora TaxID=45264 RepID=UPI001CF3A636|nr:octopine dehydrogenase-like [Acropora millepora]
MADEGEDGTCNQTKALSEKEEEETKAEEEKDEKCVVRHGDNDPDANGAAGGGRRGSFAKKLAIAGLVGVGSAAVGVIAAPAIATAALGAAGFTASGVAAGSAAAAVQSTVFGGYVASGSLFALCQSAGATGAISAATSGLIGGTTGLAGAGTTWGISKFFGGRNTTPTSKLLICGSDAGAHVLAGIASAKEGTTVRVLCLGNHKAQEWNSAIRARNIEVTFPSTETPSCISSKPSLITESEQDALQDIDIVVLMLSPNDYPIYFRALRNYIQPGTVIVGLPGSPRFTALTRHLVYATGRKCTLISFESLPWDCQITEFGTKCRITRTKESLSCEIMEGGDVTPRVEPLATLQYLLGPKPNLTVARNTGL